jgi:thioredoxin reductase (NADPH)
MPEADSVLDIIVVGAGPAGLAAAISARKSGLSCRVLEKGTLVNSIYRYPRNMVFFTTPDLLEIGGLPFTTPYEKPTRAEALRYYRRVADHYELQVEFEQEVRGIKAGPPFAVEVRGGSGEFRTYCARNVILATGYYDNPNLLGIPGEDLPHVCHYYSEPHAFFRKRVVIVGGRNSAAEAALDLYRSGVTVTLVHRGSRLSDSIKYWVRPDIENRIKEGAISARFNTCVREIRPGCVVVDSGTREELPADAVFLLTGYHCDTELLQGAGVKVRPATLAPEHDPESFETSVHGLFVAGGMVAGRETNLIFIENGRFHGDAIVKTILSRRV